jgi:hypothetical protein
MALRLGFFFMLRNWALRRRGLQLANAQNESAPEELFRLDHVPPVRAVHTAEDSMNKVFTLVQVATGLFPNEHGENAPTATRLAADPHLTRLALDNVEWCDRLARLAELRRGGQ